MLVFSPRASGDSSKRPSVPVRINSGSPQAVALACWIPYNTPTPHQVQEQVSGVRDVGSSGVEPYAGPEGWEGSFPTITGQSFRAALPLQGPFSFAIWCRPDFAYDDALQKGLFQRTTGSTNLQFYFDSGTWYLFGASGSQYVLAAANFFAANDLVHISVSFSPSGTCKIFQNGVELSTTTVGSNVPSGLDPGVWQVGAVDVPYYWSGNILDVRVYYRALTAQDVYQLYDPATRWELYNPAPRLWIPGVEAAAGSPITVTPTTASLTLSTFAPTVTAINHQLVTPSTASLSLSTFAPTVTATANKVATPTTAALILATFAPTVAASNHQIVTPSTASLSLTTFAPTVSATAHQTVTPTTAALTLATFAPTVTATANQAVTPATASLTLTTFAPTVTAAGLTVVPSTAALTLSTFAPTVSATAHATATPTTAGLVLTTFAPTVTATSGLTVTPGTLALTLATFAPTVATTAHVTATPGTLALQITTYAPSVSVSGGGFQITIGGVDVLDYLDVDTFDLDLPLNARWTLGAAFEDETAAYRPELLEEIVVTFEGVTLFTGVIIDADEQDFAAEQGIRTVITAGDTSVRLDHVFITLETAAGATLRDVVDAALAAGNVAADYGITRDPSMAPGPTLEAQTFTDASLSAVLDHLATLAGWTRRVTPDKVLVMGAIGSETAATPLTDGVSAFILGSAKRTIGEYGNRQKVRIGSGTQAQDYTFEGDGSTRTFPLPFATAQRPAQIYDGPASLIAGVPVYRNVGIHGVDTFYEWTYRASDNAIVQLTEAPPGNPLSAHTAGETFTTVSWIAQFPYTIEDEDAGEIAARGPWERPAVDAPDIFTKATGQELAAALIRRYAIWPPPRTIEVVTWSHGYVAGQVVALTSSTRDLSGDWLITAMGVSVENGMFLRYRLTLLEGDEQQATFRDYWRRVSGVGGGGATITGGIVATPVTPPPTTYWADLGGSALVDTTHSTWASVPDYRDWVCPLDGAYVCRVQVWTLDGATSVTPRLYDVTAAAAAVTGSSSTSTSRAEQTLGFTAVAGHRYRLQVLPGNTSNGVLGLGAIEV